MTFGVPPKMNIMSLNRLAAETSPYLLQHKDNPVHWWAWGPDALAEAKRSNRPILLSVGYAACHWCHVMAHESFEDEATAALMNALFVNIKVDREERPDIDAIYMAALHSLGEQGGWPLTMFLTADAEPFWGGTYFPKDARYGRASFSHVLNEISRLYTDERERVAGNAAAIRAHLIERRPAAGPDARIEPEGIAGLARSLARATDPVRGGLRGAPKFPQFNVLWLMWQAGIRFDLAECREAVLVSLRNICQGGIYDHIGGGFARYSVDEQWLVPHFEKMLYDNALLIQLLTEAFRETGESLFAGRVEETVAWLKREMRTQEGAFASSYDADSEGEEGKFYVWTPAQVREVLGEEDGALFCGVYDITEAGNFEGHNIPNRLAELRPGSTPHPRYRAPLSPKERGSAQSPPLPWEEGRGEGWGQAADDETEARLRRCRDRLLVARKKRVPPGWDDKVLADWNGLAIAALATAGRTFDREDWIKTAGEAFEFVSTRMIENGRLRHAFRTEQLRGPGTASDFANMLGAAVALHLVTGRAEHLDAARGFERTVFEHFWIADRGGYAFTADDTDDVIVRTESAQDDATPNANAVMVANLTRLHGLTAEPVHIERAEATLRAFLPDAANRATSHTGLLTGALELHAPMQVVIVRGQTPSLKESDPMLAALTSLSLPGAVEQVVADTTRFPEGSPLAGKIAIGGQATAYVCVGGVCSAPVTDPGELRTALLKARKII